MKQTFLVLVFLAFFGGAAFAEPVPQSTGQMQLSFAPLVKKTSPAVVNIYAKRVVREQMRLISPFFNDPFFGQFFGAPGFGGVRERVENSLGSGVVVDSKGTVATNTHVIKGATEISVVTADGREFSATKILSDEKTDLAVLRVEAKGEVFPYLELTDSDALEVGDLVLAIGNPFGVGQTVTSGIISGLARTGVGATDYSFFIQTDAAINPGNSGGALIDMQGRLVGINSMIFSKDGGSLGIGFAVPSNMLKAVLQAAENGGKIVRPWSGVSAQAVTPDMIGSLGLKHAHGALVNKINPDGPAARAGVRKGDVITKIDGKPIQDPDALKFRLGMLGIGVPVTLTLWRNGGEKEVNMVTAPPREDPPRQESLLEGKNPLSGAVVVNISPAVEEEMGGVGRESGVVIYRTEGGNAQRLGLGRGDVILAINGVEVTSVESLKKILKASMRRWQLDILRGDRVLNLMITI